ncbi:MAG: cupin domain-containing protein [Limnohabitans sp.]|jgi:mannose-6-phosphate isomerase-like protein (cupin superfamily)
MTLYSTFEAFKAAAEQEGFDEVVVREWGPLHETAEHEHPFDVRAQMVSGDFWLTLNGQTQHLKPGDIFRVPRHTRHSEKYGPAGATFWAARAN